MVVAQFDIKGIAVLPPETDPPLIIHGNGPLAHSTALQRVQSIAWWKTQFFYRNGEVNEIQLLHSPPSKPWGKSRVSPRGIQTLRSPISKCTDHGSLCHVLRYTPPLVASTVDAPLNSMVGAAS